MTEIIKEDNTPVSIMPVLNGDIHDLHNFYRYNIEKLYSEETISNEKKDSYNTWYEINSLDEKINSPDSENREIFVAKDSSGKMIGVIDGRYLESGEFIINWLIVNQRYREKGIGTLLMEKILNTVKGSTKKEVEKVLSYHGVKNQASEKIHDNMGFSDETSEVENLYGEGKDGKKRTYLI